jgi:hypothetical protein
MLSIALQSGLPIFDLGNLELLYAPKYSLAIDPVNVVSIFVGNLLSGELYNITARKFKDHLDN